MSKFAIVMESFGLFFTTDPVACLSGKIFSTKKVVTNTTIAIARSSVCKYVYREAWVVKGNGFLGRIFLLLQYYQDFLPTAACTSW